ncbi:MAG: hypothetical protein ACLQBD_01165 [Syntrophobacteraceae bacterium]
MGEGFNFYDVPAHQVFSPELAGQLQAQRLLLPEGQGFILRGDAHDVLSQYSPELADQLYQSIGRLPPAQGFEWKDAFQNVSPERRLPLFNKLAALNDQINALKEQQINGLNPSDIFGNNGNQSRLRSDTTYPRGADYVAGVDQEVPVYVDRNGTLQKALTLTPENVGMLEDAKRQLIASDNPTLVRPEGETDNLTRLGSGNPSWFVNNGFTKQDIYNLVDKATAGEPLTEKQTEKLKTILGAKENELIQQGFKPPWMMTRDEYVQDAFQKFQEGINRGMQPEQARAQFVDPVVRGSHLRQVQQAITDGKKVPQEVLNEYPELRQTNIPQIRTPLDEKAHEAATSPLNNLPEPTQAQKEAGNYKKGAINFQGLDISIENPKGSVRSGVDENGQPWTTTLPAHYGYLKGVTGADKDHLDIYIGPDQESSKVFVVDQQDPKTGRFDEHKVIAGADSLAQAQQIYNGGFSDGLGPQRMQAINELSMDGFKDWLKKGDTTKPFAAQADKYKETGNAEEISGHRAIGTERGQVPEGEQENRSANIHLGGGAERQPGAVTGGEGTPGGPAKSKTQEQIDREKEQEAFKNKLLGYNKFNEPVYQWQVDAATVAMMKGEPVNQEKVAAVRAADNPLLSQGETQIQGAGQGGERLVPPDHTNLSPSEQRLEHIANVHAREHEITAPIHSEQRSSEGSERAGQIPGFADRQQIQSYLQGIKPEEIKALKLKSPKEYRAVLKSMVRKLFPEGADIQFRRQGRVIDYDHFLTDSARQEYIHSLPATLKRGNVKLEFKNGDINKEILIKKYFDPDIQKDIWDVVVKHNNEIRTKFARKGGKGRGYVEGQIERAGNVASRSAMPKGNTEDASTRIGPPSSTIIPNEGEVNPEGGPVGSERAALSEQAVPVPTGVDEDSAKFIQNKVRELGSIEAVNAAYPFDAKGVDPVSQYARDLAEQMFGEPAQASFPSDLRRSVAGQSATGLHLSSNEVSQAIQPILAKWKNGPQVRVVQSVDDLPPFRFGNLEANAGRLRGLYHAGSNVAYLIADNLGSAREAQETLLHEGFHGGLRDLLAENFTSIMQEVYGRYGKLGLSDIATKYNLDLSKPKDRLIAAEEKLARMAETGENPGLLKRVYAAVRDALRSMGFKIKMNDADIDRIIMRSQARLESEPWEGRGRINEFAQGARMSLKEGDQKEAISNLYDYAIQDKSSGARKIDLGSVGPQEATFLKDKTSQVVEGYKHVLDNYAIRHILKRHGNAETEATRGQLPVTREDLAAIPEIIASPDDVAYMGKNSHGLDVIRYEKRINGKTYYFEEVRSGKRELAADTMYIKAATPRATSSEGEGVAHTSETFGGSESNNISPETEPRKPSDDNTRFSIAGPASTSQTLDQDRRMPLDRASDTLGLWFERMKTWMGASGDSSPATPAFEGGKANWFAARGSAAYRAYADSLNQQDELSRIVGEKTFGPESRKADELVHLYRDIQRSPDDVSKYWDKLNERQRATITEALKVADNPELKAFAERQQAQEDALGKMATDAGVIRQAMENHVNRIWDLEGKGTQGESFRKFGATTGHAKERMFDTILDGWAHGYDLAIKGSIESQRILKEEISNTIADKNFIKWGEKAKVPTGEIDSEGNPIMRPLFTDHPAKGDIEIEHPNFKDWKVVGKVTPESDEDQLAKFGIDVHSWNPNPRSDLNTHAQMGEQGTGINVKSWRKDIYITPDGTVMQRSDLYAPADVASRINKIMGTSKLKGIPAIDFITKANAKIKNSILTWSLFHPQAFLRSYFLATPKDENFVWNPSKATRAGMDLIKGYDPVLEHLVQNGMTLFRNQDWEQEALRQPGIATRFLNKLGPRDLELGQKLTDLNNAYHNWLFGKLGAGLKAMYAVAAYKKAMKDFPDMNPDRLARMVADGANNNFGGINLQMKERNPTVQHLFRLLALAPDWTESNFNAFKGMFQKGEEGEFYRRFWAGAMAKGITAMVVANLVMAVGDDKDPWERLKTAWKAGKLRWLDVDVTPIYRAMGGRDDTRKYFRVMGHFLDPLRMMTDPIRFSHNKGSAVYRTIYEALSGTDWRGRTFTNADELLKLTGDPDKAQFAGQLTKEGKGGPIGLGQIPSYALDQARQDIAIPFQNIASLVAGEIDGFDALTKGAGIYTGSYKPTTEAQDVMNEYYRMTGTHHPGTQQQYEYGVLRHDMLTMGREGRIGEMNQKIQEAMSQGKLTQLERKNIIEAVKDGPLVSGFKKLPVEKALDVFDVANHEERVQLWPWLMRKGATIKNLDIERRQGVLDRFQKLLQKSALNHEKAA